MTMYCTAHDNTHLQIHVQIHGIQKHDNAIDRSTPPPHVPPMEGMCVSSPVPLAGRAGKGIAAPTCASP